MLNKPVVVDLSPLHNLGPGGISNSNYVDGKHLIVSCSRCRKALCDIWLTQPELEVYSKVVALCDYCGGRSYEQDVHGKFHLGITDDSTLVDIQHDFLDGPSPESTGIYQKMTIKTKRTK